MASSSFPNDSGTGAGTEAEGAKSITIMVNDNREAFYDQEAVQSILDSNQQSTRVTFVRVGDGVGAEDAAHLTDEFVSTDAVTLDVTGGGARPVLVDADPGLESLIMADPNIATSTSRQGTSGNPIMMLDQDQLSQLESVLQSEEGKGMLAEVITSQGQIVVAAPPADVAEAQAESPAQKKEDSEGGDASSRPEEQERAGQKSQKSSPPKRRSQRQIDREMKEEAERIRLENQARMKKEEEEAKKTATGDEEVPVTMAPAIKTKVADGRPKRERKIPAHLKSGDYESSFVTKAQQKETKVVAEAEAKEEKIEPESIKDGTDNAEKKEGDDDDDMDSEDDWNSEDDPERLWCICKQPHNNRFMICCDTCLEWFHGKCVGVTKGMGKEMEEAGNEWRCPKCKKGDEERMKEGLVQKLKEREEDKKRREEEQKKQPKKKTLPLKRNSSKNRPGEGLEKPKPKERTCFMCSKPPRNQSIFCSDECIVRHAAKAKDAFQKDKTRTKPVDHSHGKSVTPTPAVASSQIMVMDPKANTILNGPSAPTEGNLETWLLKHPSFHVVMPTKDPTSRFYGTSKKSAQPASKGPKVIPPHRQISQSEVDKKLAEYKSKALSSLEAAKQYLKEHEQHTHKKIDHVRKEPKLSRSNSNIKVVTPQNKRDHHLSSPSLTRRSSDSGSTHAPSTPPKPKPKDSRSIRENAVKGMEDALRSRMEKSGDQSLDKEKLKVLVREIEEQLFRFYNKDVGPKYKAKYRSLVFNIKDEKNNGLFRKVASGKIGPRALVAMTADEMASKELQQWRQAELKHDIEKIKSFEKEQLARGTTFVVKSHKGETITTAKKEEDVRLPEEMAAEEVAQTEKDSSHTWSEKTWEHGKHAFDSLCDVCTGHKTMDEFIIAKAKRREERKKKEKERERRRRKEREERHRRHSSSHHHGRHSSSREGSSGVEEHHRHHHHRHHHSPSSSTSSHHSKSKGHKSDDKNNQLRSSSGKVSSSSSPKGKPKVVEKGDKPMKAEEKDSSKDGESQSKNDSVEIEESKTAEKHFSSSGKQGDDSTKHHHHHHKGDHSYKGDHHHHNRSSEEGKAAAEAAALKAEEERKAEKAFEEKLARAEKVLSAFKSSGEQGEVRKESPMEALTARVQNTDEKASPEETVSSTVNIATPPQTTVGTSGAKSENEAKPEDKTTVPSPSSFTLNKSAWTGEIEMQDVARFSVTASSVAGPSDHLYEDLHSSSLKIVGRIDPKLVWTYIEQLVEVQTKEIVLIRFDPLDDDQQGSYDDFYSYLQRRGRFAVIGNVSRIVKDCYILPLAAEEKLHDCLLSLEGPGMPDKDEKTDALLGLLVRAKRKRPEKSLKNCREQSIRLKKKEPRKRSTETPPLLTEDIVELTKKRPVSEEEGEEYDPAMAGQLGLSSASPTPSPDDDDDIYDPESAFDEAPPAKKKKDDPKPITSSGGGFTEELAKLTKEIERQKAELASMGEALPDDLGKTDISSTSGPAFSTDLVSSSSAIGPVAVKGFQGLPNQIANILFGNSSSNSAGDDGSKVANEATRKQTSLSAMSDADLLAKAQEMEAEVSGGSLSAPAISEPPQRQEGQSQMSYLPPPMAGQGYQPMQFQEGHSMYEPRPPPVGPQHFGGSEASWMAEPPPPPPPPPPPRMQQYQSPMPPHQGPPGPWIQGFDPSISQQQAIGGGWQPKLGGDWNPRGNGRGGGGSGRRTGGGSGSGGGGRPRDNHGGGGSWRDRDRGGNRRRERRDDRRSRDSRDSRDRRSGGSNRRHSRDRSSRQGRSDTTDSREDSTEHGGVGVSISGGGGGSSTPTIDE